LHNKRARAAAAAVAGSALLVAAWPVAAHWMTEAPHPAGVGQADALGLAGAGPNPGATSHPRGEHARPEPQIVGIAVASRPGRHRKPGQAAVVPPSYQNPLRAVTGLVLERVDMGVDFSGSGPVYALGDAVITNATATNSGWPGGGWITYQLTDGPAEGLMVYVAEDVTPTVQVGQHVSSSTVIGNMYEGGDGIETGWAQASGVSAESQLPEAGSIGGYGPFPTMVGLNFDELLQSLGVPAAPNSNQPGSGLLPAEYPTSWG
jgi:murein DD-endopeptidase MepM/ murein hydrolase activator NlpD